MYVSTHRVKEITITPIHNNGDTWVRGIEIIGKDKIAITLFANKEEKLKIALLETQQVILCQKDGVVELDSKPDGVRVKLIDYDTEGIDELDKDKKGINCIITKWN